MRNYLLLLGALFCWACTAKPTITTTTNSTATSINHSTTWEITPWGSRTRITLDSSVYLGARTTYIYYRKMQEKEGIKTYQMLHTNKGYEEEQLDSSTYCRYHYAYYHKQSTNQDRAARAELMLSNFMYDRGCLFDSTLYAAVNAVLMKDLQEQLLLHFPTDTLRHCSTALLSSGQAIKFCYTLAPSGYSEELVYEKVYASGVNNYVQINPEEDTPPFDLNLGVQITNWDEENTVFTRPFNAPITLPREN